MNKLISGFAIILASLGFAIYLFPFKLERSRTVSPSEARLEFAKTTFSVTLSIIPAAFLCLCVVSHFTQRESVIAAFYFLLQPVFYNGLIALIWTLLNIKRLSAILCFLMNCAACVYMFWPDSRPMP
jgi:hypothetical protein